MTWLAVGLGAAFGAWARWGLGLWLNAIHVSVPLGTLAANLGGGYLIGLALSYFAFNQDIAQEWRLFVIPGFLGGLTTFSAFSGESMLLLQRGEYAWAAGHILLHLIGSIALCIAGFATHRFLAG